MASGDETPSFSSDAEEAKYWRGKAGEWKKAAEAAKEELDEFQEGSRELEHELETQLEQAEMKNKDLKALTNRLQLENEQLRDKLEQCSRDYHFQINELETELAEIKGIKDKLHRYVRELEQQNDDLERVQRSKLGRFRGKNECCHREKCLPRVRTRREGEFENGSPEVEG